MPLLFLNFRLLPINPHYWGIASLQHFKNTLPNKIV
jgi:hypothetical protein